ncbi:uncharacterized protein LOC131004872 [Salvia miltiorrhiza]|uniref:uncharacterized protein LOC131004872 n=1 Tax=Salvia miltiorrhiza TaxID=226208 RepID=UPI0025AD2CED|nr:uncharacterized protein LOC131004872 [Salvia miltiorrhiza]
MVDRDKFACYFHIKGRFEEVEVEGCVIECYTGGLAFGRYDLDVDRFGYFDMVDLIDKLGMKDWERLRYLKPMSNSYNLITSDQEVMEMLSYLTDEIRVVHVFVEGGVKVRPPGKCIRVPLDAWRDDDYVPQTLAELHASRAVPSSPSPNENVTTDVEAPLPVDATEAFGDDDELDKMIDDYEGSDGECNEESSEDSDYVQPEGDDSDCGLTDIDLASGDEEYVESKKKMKGKDRVFNYIDDEEITILGNEETSVNLSDYASSDGFVNSSESDEDGGEGTGKLKKIYYNPKCDHSKLKLKLGMRFQDGWECRQAITTWAIEHGRHVNFKRVSAKMCEAYCKPPCNWRVYGSVVSRDNQFYIKTLLGRHSCTKHMENPLLSSKWIAERYINVFRIRPDLKIEDLKNDIWDRFTTKVGKDRLYKARSIAKQLVRGSVEEHYNMLGRYLAELRRVDPDGSFVLLQGEDHLFKGLYVCHSALRRGFKAGCRPIVGLDGCHLKTYLGGILLCAVGKDGNNQMFPIAWAVVEIESEDTWTWFLKLLCYDLEIGEGGGWTFISDQQKGLENAVQAITPFAEHRNCARHVYMNWKKSFKGATLKNMFWRAVRATTVAQYKAALLEMKKEDALAFEGFVSKDVNKFCKAFLTFTACSDMIDNNISETFNGWILNARGKHIIHMLEEIRTSLMSRQVQKLDKVKNSTDVICPEIRKKLEKLRHQSRHCIPAPALGGKFEITLNEDKYVVYVEGKECACRVWQLTGIPCVHAICAIQFMSKDISDYVSKYYSTEKYLATYEYSLEPVNGPKLWPEVEGSTVKPPAIRRMPGRPKIKRKRALEEDPKRPGHLRRFGQLMTCQNCQQTGHNKKTCKNEKVEKATEKRKRGRPRIEEAGRLRASTNKDGASSSKQTPREDGPSSEAATIAKEKNLSKKGSGVYVSLRSGNYYYQGRRVTTVTHPIQGRGRGMPSTSTSQLTEAPRGRGRGRPRMRGRGVSQQSSQVTDVNTTQESRAPPQT